MRKLLARVLRLSADRLDPQPKVAVWWGYQPGVMTTSNGSGTNVTVGPWKPSQ